MILAKPISSPSRVETFPPPLLRFLRSNGGSKSRGRCRSSPIFIQNKKSGRNQATSNNIVTQEPSSPKVTCMGQVRVRRSKQTGKKNMKKKKKKNFIYRNGYQWIQKTLFCCNFNEKLKPKTNTSNKPYWGRWVLPNFRRKSKIQEESTKREDKIEDFEETTEEEEEEEEEKVGVFIASSPPKNALLLMRCRSEPYRASSLANQFWGSPSLTNQQQEEEEEEEEEERECKTEQKHIEDEEEEEEEKKPTLEKEQNCRDSTTESITVPETEEKMGFYQGFERSSSTTSTKTCSKIEAETSKIPSSSSSRPLLLTRCKSEPATRSEKFQVETCFWKKKDWSFFDISTTGF